MVDQPPFAAPNHEARLMDHEKHWKSANNGTGDAQPHNTDTENILIPPRRCSIHDGTTLPRSNIPIALSPSRQQGYHFFETYTNEYAILLK